MQKTFTLFVFICLCGFFGNPATAQVIGPDYPNPLPIPYTIDSDNIEIEMSEHLHHFNPNGDPNHYLFDPIPAFAFNQVGIDPSEAMTILGPSLIWNYQANVNTSVTNNIDRVSTTHWHGAHVPQFADGGPHQMIEVGETWNINFDILDKSATMWYHPHAMDITYEQVQLGLSGMIIVEDPVDGVGDDAILTFIHDISPHTYGEDDFPLIIQTKQFYFDSSVMDYRINDTLGFSSDYEYLVNGVMNPTLELPDAMTRLRVLNGDGKFTFNLGLVDADLNPIESHLWATDAGYMPQSRGFDDIYVAPGERTEWLVDLRGYAPGTELYLVNKVSGFPNNGSIIGDSQTTGGFAVDTAIMKIVIAENNNLPPSPIIAFPISLLPSEAPPVHPWTKARTKVFERSNIGENCEGTQTFGSGLGRYLIDSIPMSMMCVNDTIMLDSTETWSIVNKTNRAHPLHIHDTHFWVTEYLDNTTTPPTSIPYNDWPIEYYGPKDNVLVPVNRTVTFVASFLDFGTTIEPNNSYMYHCHILPHEDRGMMGQFVVWDPFVNSEEVPIEPQEFTLFPNPTTNELFLKSSAISTSEVRFLNLQGQVLRKQQLAAFSGQTSLEIQDLPKGIVLVEWLTDGERFVEKVVVQ